MNILKAILTNGKSISLMEEIKSELSPILIKNNLDKVDNIIKLIYKLFLLSTVGVFIKLIAKFLKF